MKNSLSVRQICFILIAYNAVLKLVLYPSSAAAQMGGDLIFPALISLAIETAVIWSVAFLSSRTDKTFFELLTSTFGKVVARIIYTLFGLYFLFAAIVPMNEQQMLMHTTFYDTVPSLFVFLPFFFFSIYAGAKSFTNTGRCADVCLPIFLIAAVGFIAMSVGQADFTNLLPAFTSSPVKMLNGVRASIYRFSEAAFLLLFMGHYKYRKGDSAKLTLSYAFGGLVVILFMAIFYGLYGALTPSRSFILNDISVFFPAISYVGRVDLILLYVLDMVMLFAVVLHIQACVHCLSCAFGCESRALLSLCANVVLVIITFVLNNKSSFLQTAAGGWFFIPVLVFAYVVPVLAWTLKRRSK